jgi:hypothetical protein
MILLASQANTSMPINSIPSSQKSIIANSAIHKDNQLEDSAF